MDLDGLLLLNPVQRSDREHEHTLLRNLRPQRYLTSMIATIRRRSASLLLVLVSTLN